jgi:hypothetical protein
MLKLNDENVNSYLKELNTLNEKYKNIYKLYIRHESEYDESKFL